MSLQAQNLTLQRGHRRLLTDFNLALVSGDGVSLRGPNGSGKTTLLRALGGLHLPHSGVVSGQQSDDGVAMISFMGHLDPIKPAEKLRDHLAFWATISGRARDAVPEAAAQMGLTKQLELQGGVLSAGQRRRASMARLVIEARPIWLLDEPAAPLDQDGRALLGALLDTHRAGGGMFVAAVHDELPGLPTQTITLGAS